MCNRNRNIENRFTLTIAILVGAFFLLVVTGTVIQGIFRQTRAIEQELALQARSELRQIDLRLSYLFENIESLASSSLMINSLTGNSGHDEHMQQAMRDFVRTDELSNVVVFDHAGNILTHSGDGPPSGFSRAQARQTIVMNRWHSGLSENGESLIVTAPIRYSSTARGGLGIEVDLLRLVGNILAENHLHYEFTLGSHTMPFGAENSTGISVTGLLDDDSLLSTLGARLVVTRSAADAYQPLLQILMEMSMIGILGLALSIYFARRVARGLTRPIITLTERVRNKEYPCGPVGTHDELETLAREFDNNTRELIAANEELEARVGERTAQLELQAALLQRHTEELELSNTALEKANHELTTLDEMKDEFVSTVSHELRTPLTSINGVLSLIHNGVMDNHEEERRRLLDIALSNSARLSRLIDDLLDFNKLAAGKIQLAKTQLNLQEFLGTALEENRGYADKYQVKLILDRDSCIDVAICADPIRFRQVIDNLLSNAIKFSPAGDSVDIYARAGDKHARVCIRDHGNGIPADFRDRIFEAFSQADASTTRRHDGTGLGLSISRRLMDAHQGGIGFEDAAGGGTIFWVDIPLAHSGLTAPELASAV